MFQLPMPDQASSPESMVAAELCTQSSQYEEERCEISETQEEDVYNHYIHLDCFF